MSDAFARGEASQGEEAVRHYQTAAELGHVHAQFKLAKCYQDGVGVEQNDEKAIHWFLAAARQGHPVANYCLGEYHLQGKAVAQDFVKANEYHTAAKMRTPSTLESLDKLSAWQTAADQNDTEAQYQLGVFLMEGEFSLLDSNPGRAMTWFAKAAGLGHAEAAARLGQLYAAGNGVDKDIAKAVEYLETASRGGSANAPLHLAELYATGSDGMPVDESKAADWYLMAAERGNAKAQAKMGEWFNEGVGVEKDKARAIEMYRAAAQQPEFQHYANYANFLEVRRYADLATQYATGNGVEKNMAEAARFCLMAAELGDADSQCQIAHYFKRGEGVAQDHVQAAKWYHAAAEQNNMLAKRCLGGCYFAGNGVSQDFMKAAEYYEVAHVPNSAETARKAAGYLAAAQQNDPQGQYDLAWLYFVGHDTLERDFVKAIELFEQAARQQFVPACIKLGEIYAAGFGVPGDHNKALEWYEVAARQGHAESQFRAGEFYVSRGDDAKAVEWFQAAANQGHKEAQVNLAHCYNVGKGVPMDKAKALELYHAAGAEPPQDPSQQNKNCSIQ